MPYPPKPDAAKRQAFGVSLDRQTVERIDALAESVFPSGGQGRRSLFIRDLIELGLCQRFGANWREIADRLRSADRLEVPA